MLIYFCLLNVYEDVTYCSSNFYGFIFLIFLPMEHINEKNQKGTATIYTVMVHRAGHFFCLAETVIHQILLLPYFTSLDDFLGSCMQQ